MILTLGKFQKGEAFFFVKLNSRNFFDFLTFLGFIIFQLLRVHLFSTWLNIISIGLVLWPNHLYLTCYTGTEKHLWNISSTVWIFQDISVSQILREITFWGSRSSKRVLFEVLEPVNFEIGKLRLSKRCNFFKNSKRRLTKKRKIGIFWTSGNTNWFHVKSEQQKNPKLSTLWVDFTKILKPKPGFYVKLNWHLDNFIGLASKCNFWWIWATVWNFENLSTMYFSTRAYTLAWLNFDKSGQITLPRLSGPDFWQTWRMPPILWCHTLTKRNPTHLKF